MAAYGYVRKPYYTAGFVLIQHGSYQWISEEDQPLIESGDVVLYRGIGQAAVFRQLRFQPDELSSANREIWRRYLALQAKMLSDSVLSFNTIHDRIRRCETGGLRHGTWLADQLIADAGLDIQAPGFAKELWESAQQSYSLDPNIGKRKFGPYYVAVRTALSNIRITTFFAGSPRSRSSIRAASKKWRLSDVTCSSSLRRNRVTILLRSYHVDSLVQGRVQVFGGSMVKEHDCVDLTSKLPSEGLLSCDVGTILHIYGDAAAYEVELATLTGMTIAVTTAFPSQCRPIGHRDIGHVREIPAE